jgi:putative two-component system response regulator
VPEVTPKGQSLINKNILVIDDDPVLLTMIQEYLENAGFKASTADCGIDSNHIVYGTPPPDLIVLDVIMPLMSSVKKARLLKQREKSS